MASKHSRSLIWAQDDENIQQRPEDIPVWSCGSQFVKYDIQEFRGNFGSKITYLLGKWAYTEVK